MTTETNRRPLLHPTNVRFAVMVLLIAVVVFGANMCSQSLIVNGVVGSEPITRLPDDLGAIQRGVSAVDTSVKRVDREVARIAAQEPHVVYSYDPGKQSEPPARDLERLRNLVATGASLRVVRRPVGAKGPITNIFCAAAIVDENGSVLCTSEVLPANLVLPDGRRYQETVRHDGTVLFAHWDANGGNVQGNREIARYVVTWLANGPIE